MVLCLSNPAIASELEDVVLMSLSAADGRAVVKTVDGTMHVLGEGDVIPGLGKENKTTILHIQPGRLGWSMNPNGKLHNIKGFMNALSESGCKRRNVFLYGQFGGKAKHHMKINRGQRTPQEYFLTLFSNNVQGAIVSNIDNEKK